MDKQNVTPVWIWSDEHQGYWKPDGCGYTAAAVNAGVWSQQDAESITRHCGPEKKIRLIPLPDDFRLAQARLLCPDGYAVAPVEPPMEVLAAASYPQAAFIFYREIIAYARNSKWIVSAAEGK